MFSIWRIRVSAVTIIVIVSALIRGGNVWLRQFNAQWKAAQYVAQPTFVAPVAAMQRAQTSAASSTPVSALDAEAYVATMALLLEEVQTQLYTVLNTYDDFSAHGEMTVLVYNYGVREIVSEAETLHRTANKIRAIHPPKGFASYHAETLRALATFERALITLMRMADGGLGLTQVEQDELTRIFNEAAATLNTYPRITNRPEHGRPVATLHAAILNAKLHVTPTPPQPTSRPNNAP